MTHAVGHHHSFHGLDLGWLYWAIAAVVVVGVVVGVLGGITIPGSGTVMLDPNLAP